MINETKLNNRHHITFKEYNIIREDRPNSKQGGGTAILIKNKFKYVQVKINSTQSENHIEHTTIKIKLNNNKQLYLIAIYCSSNSNMLTDIQFEKEWDEIFEQLNLINSNNYFVIAGDFNARHSNWGNSTNNQRGIKLNRWLEDNSSNYRTKLYKADAPTCVRSGNYIDLAIVDNRLIITTNDQNEIASHAFDSDHKAIEIKCSNIEELENSNNTDHKDKYNFINMNWTLWKRKLSKAYKRYLWESGNETIIANNRNSSNVELENNIITINKIITANIQTNTHKTRRSNNMEVYTNNTIEKLYRHKSRIITLLKRNKRNGINNPLQNNLMKAEITRTKELIEQNVKIEYNKYWKHKLETIKPGPKMFHNIKNLSRTRSKTNTNELEIAENESQNMSALNINWSTLRKNGSNYCINNNQQILNILGHYIEKRTIPNTNLGKLAHENVVLQTIQPLKNKHLLDKQNHKTKTKFSANNRAFEPIYPTDPNYFIGIAELKAILKCTNTKKSYGLDEIPNIVLKHLPDELITELCSLFNQLLNNKSFPNQWKKAKVYPIAKKNKNTSNAQNYRPISLLSNISKIYEIIIFNKLQEHTYINNLLPDNQFGFRYGHSTIHAVTKLTSDICDNLNNKSNTGAVFLDMNTAFESVWLDGLLYKLHKMKFQPELIEILHEMLYDRRFVTTNGLEKSSRTFTIYNGLQQGSVTAPILFNLYTSELISNEKINSDKIQTIAYADDIVIYSSGSKISNISQKLQSTVNFITDYLHTWRIGINANKCETILFRKPINLANRDTKRNWKQLTIQIGNITIQQKPLVKYLGINIDRLCYLNEHINLQLIKARKAFISNKKIFLSKYINKEVKTICYQTLIRPIITYGCPVWYNINPSYMEKIRIFERRCMRHCRGVFRKADTIDKHYISNQNQYDNFRSNRIDIHIIQLIRNHILRTTSNSSNSLLYGPYYTNDTILLNSISKYNIPGPEAFILLDKMKYIQSENQIPLIYHVMRRPNEKGFDEEKFSAPENHLRFSTAFRRVEPALYQEHNQKYWWLTNT